MIMQTMPMKSWIHRYDAGLAIALPTAPGTALASIRASLSCLAAFRIDRGLRAEALPHVQRALASPVSVNRAARL
jgi:hypothetical protein